MGRAEVDVSEADHAGTRVHMVRRICVMLPPAACYVYMMLCLVSGLSVLVTASSLVKTMGLRMDICYEKGEEHVTYSHQILYYIGY